MKCINCGAELSGTKCEYCGSEYTNNNLTATFNTEDTFGTLSVGNKSYEVYLGAVEYNKVLIDCAGRDVNGRIIMPKVKTKRRFTLIEK